MNIPLKLSSQRSFCVTYDSRRNSTSNDMMAFDKVCFRVSKPGEHQRGLDDIHGWSLAGLAAWKVLVLLHTAQLLLAHHLEEPFCSLWCTRTRQSMRTMIQNDFVWPLKVSGLVIRLQGMEQSYGICFLWSQPILTFSTGGMASG